MGNRPALVVLAAGLGTRYGGLKQLTRVGPHGETLLDYGVYDAARVGFGRVVMVIRREVEDLFRRHVTEFMGAAVEVVYAHQLSSRARPWGTGHAVLAAAPAIAGPFAVMNADDCYGADAFRVLHEHLERGRDEQALVGYALRETLSAHGGVSRAIAEVDARGYLSRLTEVADIARRGSTAELTGRTTAGQAVTLDGRELVSMNLWGFAPAVLAALERQFTHFLELHAGDPRAEFLLSEAVAALVEAGETRVRVLDTHGLARWFGMTFSADDEGVRRDVRRLVDSGLYPANLKDGVERLACD